MASSTHPHEMAAPNNNRTSRVIGQKNITLSRALDKAKTAVERDQAGNVRGALASYRSARELLTKARRRMSSDDDALKLDAIGRTYDNRIRELREVINNEPRDDDKDSSQDTSSSETSKPPSGASQSRPTPPPTSHRRTNNTAYSPQDSSDSQQETAPRKPRLIARKPIGQSPRITTTQPPLVKRTVTPIYPPRRDSHQQWPLTPELETKATVEHYMKRKLPSPPNAGTPRYVPHFDDCLAADEMIDWWNDLLEGGNRWSMSSDKTLVASPGMCPPKEYRNSGTLSPGVCAVKEYRKLGASTFAQQQNGSESPTDSVRFWSPPATPMKDSFGNGMGVAGRGSLAIRSSR